MVTKKKKEKTPVKVYPPENQHPDGPRRLRRKKFRMNNKKHTIARLKYGYGRTSNVPKLNNKELKIIRKAKG